MIRRITFCDVTRAVARYTLSFRPLFRDDPTGSGQAAHDTAHHPARRGHQDTTGPWSPLASPSVLLHSPERVSLLPGALVHCSSPHWHVSPVWPQCFPSFTTVSTWLVLSLYVGNGPPAPGHLANEICSLPPSLCAHSRAFPVTATFP